MGTQVESSVFISFARTDIKWFDYINKFFSSFKPEYLRIRILNTLPGQKFSDIIVRTQVAVLLLSESYLTSSVSREEFDEIWKLFNEGSLKIFPVAIDLEREKITKNIEPLRKISFFDSGRPLIASEKNIESKLDKFSNELKDLLGSDLVETSVSPDIEQKEFNNDIPASNELSLHEETRTMPKCSKAVEDCLNKAFQYTDISTGISSLELLLGCLLHGRDSKKRNSANFLWSRLVERNPEPEDGEITPEYVIGLPGRSLNTEVTGTPETDNFDIDGWCIVTKAIDIADKTSRTEMIHMRHLVAALITPTGYLPLKSYTKLKEHYEDLSDLHEKIYERFKNTHPSESAESWSDVLGISSTKEPESDETSTQEAEFIDNPSMAGYSADDLRGRDRLNIRPDVNTLCAVIMDKEWIPPLSIGLFGDWGTGKSFFMNKMNKRIRLLAEHSKTVENESKTKFVPDAVQVKFNAWHYVDTNLWASLVTRIFEGLSEEIFWKSPPSLEDPLVSERRKLFEALETTKKQVEVEEQNKKLAVKAREEAQKKYDTHRNDILKINGRILSLRSFAKEAADELLKDDSELKSSFDQIARDLKLDNKQERLDEVLKFMDESRQFWKYIKRLWQWALKSKLSWFLLLLFFVFIVFVLKIPEGLVPMLDQLAAKLQALTGKAIAFIFMVIAYLSPHLKRLLRLGTIASTALSLKDKAVQRQDAALRAELIKQEILLQQANDLFNQKEAEVLQIENQIQEAESGRNLEKFLHERVASTDYTEHMGIIAIVRRDFQTLTRRLKKGITRKGADGKEELVKIDRVILYIDDLDRCPPKRVVEVLQAVHLLLAIELFVVVVAVDPRWLLNALRWHYQELFRSRSKTPEISSEEKEAWTSTPYNYLEKIFQIPFTLRTMTDKGYSKLVHGFFDPIKPEPEKVEETVPEKSMTDQEHTNIEQSGLKYEKNGVEESNIEGERDIEQNIKDEAEITDPLKEREVNMPASYTGITGNEDKNKAGEALISRIDENSKGDNEDEDEDEKAPPNLTPEGLTLSGPERELLGKMRPLISTPRSAKRMINIYRLIRAPLSESDIAKFADVSEQDSEFVAVQILLGILVGCPGMAADIFRGLRSTNESSFWTYVRSLLPVKPDNSTSTRNSVREELNEVEHRSWEQFYNSMNRLQSSIESGNSEVSPELKEAFKAGNNVNIYKRWLETVARYSFRTGHVVSTMARRGYDIQ